MKTIYEEIEIPNFNQLGLEGKEAEKASNIYLKLCNVLREEIGLFEIHIASLILSKLSFDNERSIHANRKLITKEYKRRMKLKEEEND